MNKSGTRRWLTIAGMALAAAAITSCGIGLQNANGYIATANPGEIEHYDSLEGVEITVGAKDFTEQLVLGNMLSTVLDAAGADVTNRANIAGSNGVRNLLLNRTVDIAPEYTGTGWISYLLHDDPVKGEEGQWKATAKEDKAENQLIWLKPSPMNNTYAFAMGPEAADKLDVENLSDLQDLSTAELTFCVEDEFYSRNDGFPNMLEAYGLTLGNSVPDKNVTKLDTGVVYNATAKGQCNFGEVFTTDGRIKALDLTPIEDDEEFFPLYNMTEVVQESMMDEHPEIEEIFASLNAEITNEVMQDLNAKVDVDGKEPALVARDFLIDTGLLKE